MTANEQAIIQEGINLLLQGLEKIKSIENSTEVSAIVTLAEAAVSAASMLMKL
jgi:hypothetical protein